MTALLPCPFCGSTRVGDYFIRDGRRVSCVCGAGMVAFQPDAREKAIRCWNTRTPAAGQSPEVTVGDGSTPLPPPTAEPDQGETCDTCQGNGEIVTDWDRYMHAHEGDTGDEAVASCPDCDGQGTLSRAPEPDQGEVEAVARIIDPWGWDPKVAEAWGQDTCDIHRETALTKARAILARTGR